MRQPLTSKQDGFDPFLGLMTGHLNEVSGALQGHNTQRAMYQWVTCIPIGNESNAIIRQINHITERL